jgi:putative glutamine amidotransferase
MGKREFKVIITGSNSGSEWAWRFINFLISDSNITTLFINQNSKVIPSSFDGLVLSGGVDINPKLYSKTVHKSVKRVEPKRDSMELKLLELAMKKSIPTLGICRGMQLINIFFGGSLIQDINDNLNLLYPHSNTFFPIKRINILKNTNLYNILGKSTIYVNAIHHQTIDSLGESLKVNSLDRNKIIEGFESSNKNFLIGVQWHPEYLPYKRDSRILFSSFKKAIFQRE